MRVSLWLSVVAAVLVSGCGGSQSQVSALGALPEAANSSRTQAASRSRMLAASGADLIYATGGCGGTCVVSYPKGQLVGSLNVGDGGACSDTSGNVYIADGADLVEYNHGGTTPVGTFSVPAGTIGGCSIDAGTGSVAVTVFQSSDYNVAIFTNSSDNPTTYLIALDAQFCGYDGTGNLFVDGYGNDFSLYELPKGSASFREIKVRKLPAVRPGQVQWDGQYLTIEGLGVTYGVTVYRLEVSGSSATIAGKTAFKDITRTALQSWIAGNNIFIPYGTRGNAVKKPKIGIWSYPSGGKALQKLAHLSPGANFQGVTFSAATL